MVDLPPELQGFAVLLDAQPQPVRESFLYCLCLMMVETGNMRLVEQVPGESGAMCRFETRIGEEFVIPRPPLSQEHETEILEILRDILDEEGLI
jgi:hypothetical protein